MLQVVNHSFHTLRLWASFLRVRPSERTACQRCSRQAPPVAFLNFWQLELISNLRFPRFLRDKSVIVRAPVVVQEDSLPGRRSKLKHLNFGTLILFAPLDEHWISDDDDRPSKDFAQRPQERLVGPRVFSPACSSFELKVF